MDQENTTILSYLATKFSYIMIIPFLTTQRQNNIVPTFGDRVRYWPSIETALGKSVSEWIRIQFIFYNNFTGMLA